MDKKGLPGTPIVQKKNCDEKWQMWTIEYQGKNLFLIRSAQDPSLFMGIKDNSIKPEDGLVTTITEEYALWKIIGFIPRWDSCWLVDGILWEGWSERKKLKRL